MGAVERPWQRKHELAHGRCLDIGCGPGRICLYLQDKGYEVVGIDNSLLAIRTAQLCGVQETWVFSITRALLEYFAVPTAGNHPD